METQERNRSNLQEFSRFLDNSSSMHGGPPTHLRQSNPYVVNRHGNYHSHCRGRIALGPGGPTYFLAIPSFAIILTIMILQNKLVTEMLGSSVTITGYVAISIGFVSFFIASTSDPGIVPKDYSYYQLMEETNYRRMLFPGERYYRYCNKCSCIRPPRSYHCKICNICIRRHDVHSYLIGTCVGERNFRSFLCLHFSLSFLSIFLLVVHTKLLINLTLLTRLSVIAIPILNLALSAISLMYGVILLTYPNLGVFLLIYRIYLICVNRTCREDYRIFSDKSIDNPPYIKSLRKNICEFMIPKFPCRSSLHSSHNRITDGSPDLVSQSLRLYAACQHGSRGVFCASIVNSSDFIIDLQDGFTYGPPSYQSQTDKTMREKVIIENLTATARKNCGSSLPQIVNGGLLSVPGFEVRNIKLARPSKILVRKIKNFHNNRALSKAEISYRKHHNEKTTLSDGCIPRTENTQVELVTMARAAQIQAIIERVISRDRRGLIDLSRRINIGALVGIDNFDPDDLQVIELNNGIPLVTRRNHNHLHQQGRHIGGAQNSSPQMVAAGFLPPAQTFLSAASRVVRRPLATGIPQNNVVSDNNNIHCVTNTRLETNRQRRRRLLLNSNNHNNNNSRGFERYFGNALTRHEHLYPVDPEDDIVDDYVNRSDSLRRQALRNAHNLQNRDSDDVIRVITTPPDSNCNSENLTRNANSNSPTSAEIILGGLRQLRRNAREHILSFTNRRPVANPIDNNQNNENSDELNETQRSHFVLMAERLSGLSRTLSQRREYLLQLQRQLNYIDDENNEYHDQLEE